VGALLGVPRRKSKSNVQLNAWYEMVGERGFEPPTPWSRTALQALLIAIVLSCFQRLWNEPAAMLSLNAVDGLDCRRH